jgi:hypothetical protein
MEKASQEPLGEEQMMSSFGIGEASTTGADDPDGQESREEKCSLLI